MNIHTPKSDRSAAIRALNDAFRTSFVGGSLMVTAAFTALPTDVKATALQRVRTFNDFDEDNDPYNEHDMGFFAEGGESMMWKIDYYAPDMMHGSDNPSDANNTRRVLTIMLASDY
jgi:hypothetical protein